MIHSLLFLTEKLLTPGGLSLVDPLGQIGTYTTTTSVETPATERYPAPLRVSARWSDAPEEGHASSTTLTPSFSVLEERHKGIRACGCNYGRPHMRRETDLFRGVGGMRRQPLKFRILPFAAGF